MIKAILFDFYNTLVRFWPPLDEIQQAACRELGINVSKRAVGEGYAAADVFFNEENASNPIALRPQDERRQFFAEYEQIIMETAGVPVSRDLARQIWDMAASVPKEFVPFDDTIPALAALEAQGYRLGVLSNLRRDVDQMCQRLGLSPYLQFCINVTEAYAEKPHPPLFLAGLERMSTAPEETVHVGDQYGADVVGARAVGIHAVLMDREGWNSKVKDCAKIASLADLGGLLAGAPHSLTSNNHSP